MWTSNTLEILKSTLHLPIVKVLDELKAALRKGSAVLAAPPGSGKTTVIPPALLDEEWLENRKILILEPRRLAARAAAGRMSWLLGEQCGQSIGYRIRFDQCISEKTRVEVLTEGILTRRIQNDPDLADVGLIIFDEFHERSLHADLALALCLEICQLSDLRLLIMSATLDTESIAKLLNGASVISCQGKSYPVDIDYLEREPAGIIEPTLHGIKRVLREREGDILAFLPGAGEIKSVHKQLAADLPENTVSLPLFGNLPFEEQNRAILPDPTGKRKVILATSIAETSLTIEGVRNIVDSGWSRRSRFNPASGLSGLETVRISKASATQRAGRAGRLGPGYCLRLWSKREQHGLLPFLPPEIISADLANLALELFLWGIVDPAELCWLDPPRPNQYKQAQDLLVSLGALKENKLTALGRKLAGLPIHPRLGLMLFKAKESGHAAMACDLAAIISERDMFVHGKKKTADLQVRVQVLELWRKNGRGAIKREGADPTVCRRIDRVSSQWLRLAGGKRQEPQYDNIANLLAYAYPDRIAKRRSGETYRYQLAQGKGARLAPADYLAASEYLVIPHLDAGQKEGRIYLAASVSMTDLYERHKSLFCKTAQIKWDKDRKKVTAVHVERLGEIIIQERNWAGVDQDLVAQAMLDGIKNMGLDCLPWNRETRQLQARVNCLNLWQPNEGWPDFTDENLFENLSWLAPYLDGIRTLVQLRSLNLTKILRSGLDWSQQQQLDQLAPPHIHVPSGSRIKLQYTLGEPPVLAVRLQELFGLAETPSICAKRISNW